MSKVKVIETIKKSIKKYGKNFDYYNLLSDDIEFYNAKKDYSDDKYLDIFKLIQEGAVITKGQLFQYFENLIKG